jgi:hypothetical protein
MRASAGALKTISMAASAAAIVILLSILPLKYSFFVLLFI